MIRKVVQDPNAVLHKKTLEVKDFKSPELSSLIKDMLSTLKKEDGLGLAAPQVGNSLSVFVIPKYISPKVRSLNILSSIIRPFNPTVFINPKIVRISKDKEILEEGCLSIKNIFRDTPRFAKVRIKAQNEEGKKFSIKAEGLLARVFQHETDHLNGILFTERL